MWFLSSARAIVGLALIVALLPVHLGAAQGVPFAAPSFEALWTRADGPIRDGAVSRAWLWGQAISGAVQEPYGPAGQRTVQYFEKGRMEIADPATGAVSTGLLAQELITGKVKTGETTDEAVGAAQLPIAGDPDDTTGPYYVTFRDLLSLPARPVGEPITETLERAGARGDQPDLGRYGVTAAYAVAETQHTIAKPFWEFLGTTGPVLVNGVIETAPLFEPTFGLTGLPISEAYWTRVKLTTNGQSATRDVLVQAFERRVLTYTPDNDAAYQVEMGNVGGHYRGWRYDGAGRQPAAAPAPSTPQAKDIVLQLSDLPAGYNVIEEKVEADGAAYTRSFEDPKRLLTGYVGLVSSAVLAPDAGLGRLAYDQLLAEVGKDAKAKATIKPVAGVGERAVTFAIEATQQSVTFRATAVAFQRANVVGVIIGGSLPDKVDLGVLVQWAKIMDGRAASVASSPAPAASPAPSGQTASQGGACPPDYPIKGNKSSSGELIYHVPGGAFYTRTKAEICFKTEADAVAAGYRRAKR